MRASKYSKQYVVKSHEVDCHGFLRLLSLMNIMQDIALENADVIGVGLDTCRQHNLSWVGSNYLLQIVRFPRLHEKFTIETWPDDSKLCSAIRNFVIFDEMKNPIIKATSQWVLIDLERRRPVAIEKYFSGYETLHEQVIAAEFMKIITPPENCRHYEYRVRFDDIDVNKHVNNAVYALWASESIDESYRFEHLPQEIEICFRKETFYGETVTVQTHAQNDESYHFITDKNTGNELAQCRIKWQKTAQ